MFPTGPTGVTGSQNDLESPGSFTSLFRRTISPKASNIRLRFSAGVPAGWAEAGGATRAGQAARANVTTRHRANSNRGRMGLLRGPAGEQEAVRNRGRAGRLMPKTT